MKLNGPWRAVKDLEGDVTAPAYDIFDKFDTLVARVYTDDQDMVATICGVPDILSAFEVIDLDLHSIKKAMARVKREMGREVPA